jgi:fibronectin-binding autotransporter adhesin
MEPSNGSPAPMLGRVLSRTLTAMAVAFLPLVAPTPAKADLSAISGDVVFGTNITLNSQVAITGNVGVGQGGSLSFNGGNTPTINGTVFLGTGATDGISGTTSQADANLTTAVSTAIGTASAAYQAMSATQGSLSSSGGNLTITATTTVNVVDVTSLASGGITLKGTASDIFIINVASLGSINGGVTLENLSGGTSGAVTANNVLFNVENSSSNPVSLSGTLNGTFLVPNATVSFGGGGTLTGAILDGQTVSVDFNAETSTTIISDTFSGLAVVAAPEPAPLVKAISGLVTVGLWGLVRRKKRSK